MEDVYQTEMDRIYHETFAPRVTWQPKEGQVIDMFPNETVNKNGAKYRYLGGKNIRVVVGEPEYDLDMLVRLASEGDWWAKSILERNGYGDYKYGSDEGEPPHNE